MALAEVVVIVRLADRMACRLTVAFGLAQPTEVVVVDRVAVMLGLFRSVEVVASAHSGYHGGFRTGTVPVQRPNRKCRPKAQT